MINPAPIISGIVILSNCHRYNIGDSTITTGIESRLRGNAVETLVISRAIHHPQVASPRINLVNRIKLQSLFRLLQTDYLEKSLPDKFTTGPGKSSVHTILYDKKIHLSPIKGMVN